MKVADDKLRSMLGITSITFKHGELQPSFIDKLRNIFGISSVTLKQGEQLLATITDTPLQG